MKAWIEALQARWQAWWPELAPREQRMVIVAGALVALALIWWVALAPALRTLATAPAAHAELDAQLQQMAALQIQAKALQSQPRANREDALRALETSVRQGLGPNAQIQVAGAGAGEGVLVTLRATPADGLAQWLAQARGNARAVPREVHLTRTQGAQQAPVRASSGPSAFASGPGAANAAATAAAAAAAADTRVRWDGTLVMNLPAR